MSEYTHASGETYPVSYPTDGPIDVSVRGASGDITVTATDTAEVTVDIRASGRDADDLVARTEVHYRPGSLRIEAPKRNTSAFGFGRGSVDIDVTVPTGSTADLHSGSGDIRMDGEFGAVVGKTGSGSISIASCADGRLKCGSGKVTVQRCGDLQVSTGSGAIVVGHADGSVSLDAGSGDIEVSGSVGSGRVKTGSGDVTIAHVDGTFEVKTASGDIALRRVPAGDLKITAASGDVTVGIESGTAAHLDVSSVSGRVRSELDETDAPAESDRTVLLAARTVSGSITVHRAA